MLLAAAWTAYVVWRVTADVDDAETSAAALLDAVVDEDLARARTAALRLQGPATAAADRTDGPWWEVLTWAPVLGDDADGLRAVGRSLGTVADDGVGPLVEALTRLDHLTVDGRVDLRLVRDVTPLVTRAEDAFGRASALVAKRDSEGYVGPLRDSFDEYAERLAGAADGLATGRQALDVLPTMVGADGPRTYLLVFENNAEIRATGGLPGSWGLVHARDGRLTMDRQGSGGEVEKAAPGTVLRVSRAERRIFGEQLSHYFRSANATPDFPRVAELVRARWEAGGGEPLDGVMSIDVRAMAYLLRGTGPIEVRDLRLTGDNLVEALLSRAYEVLPPELQDQAFEEAAKAVFDATQRELLSPLRLLYGLGRAAQEGRFHLASFREPVAEALAGSDVLGELPGDDGTTPHVGVTVNDATGSKMSYYLRYGVDVDAASCADGSTQVLEGRMRVAQLVDVARAKRLPDYVTGGGQYGVEPGTQLVAIRLYAPYGGSVDDITVDGQAIGRRLAQVTEQDGREVATLFVQTSDAGSDLSWTMTGGRGQTGDVAVDVTPSIEPMSSSSTAPSAC
ncbi:DUF4012 domain-containing protein [Nocardioides sp. SOB77]|uniref:DUF4012 domain-containing protein n=1 Tax=Nocardioides oceani TaxID=3058369 RepID=A0ABT8FJ49_9ACTN|nr:DUF4012 domain-containing protein [Nocardioides oceani]MDN4174530.1 DUF4012 domain-containing protein [Nocardioides oceani]